MENSADREDGAALREGRVIPLDRDSYYTRLLTDPDMQADRG